MEWASKWLSMQDTRTREGATRIIEAGNISSDDIVFGSAHSKQRELTIFDTALRKAWGDHLHYLHPTFLRHSPMHRQRPSAIMSGLSGAGVQYFYPK